MVSGYTTGWPILTRLTLRVVFCLFVFLLLFCVERAEVERDEKGAGKEGGREGGGGKRDIDRHRESGGERENDSKGKV